MSRRGFTLLEVLLTMAVIATLGILVAPMLSGSLGRGRLDAQARAVVALARHARALAAAEGRTYLLEVDGAARTARLARWRDPLAAPEGDDPEVDLPAEAAWARVFTFEEGIELAVARPDPAEFRDGRRPLAWSGETVWIAFHPQGEADGFLLVFRGPRGDARGVRIEAALGVARVLPAQDAARELP